MNATETLLETITTALADSDKKVLDSRIASIAKRRDALRLIETEYADRRKRLDNLNLYFHKQLDAVGGKGWLELLRSRDSYVIEYLTKTHTKEVEVRNQKIASKLEAQGITEVQEAEKKYGANTFFGIWKLATPNGTKRLEIEMILAGGYNIQCLHNRVLVKIK